MHRILAATLAGLLVSTAAFASPQDANRSANPATEPKVTLQQIMADPDWIGPPVEDPYWSVDGRSLYFKLKRKGSPLHDLYRVDANGGAPVRLSDAELARADGPAVFDRAHDRAAFLRHGDVFVRDLASHATRQVTRSDTGKSSLQFSGDGSLLSWRQDEDWDVWNAATGLVSQAAALDTSNNPADAKPDQMERLQLHLFSTLRADKAAKQALRKRDDELDAENPTRASAPFYLGGKVKVVTTSLSPDAHWMLVVTEPKSYQPGKHPVVVHYVNESGYPETEKARTYVGRNSPAPQSLLLLDLRAHKQYKLSLDDLPGIHDDPLHDLRAKRIAEQKKKRAIPTKPPHWPRPRRGPSRSISFLRETASDRRSSGIATPATSRSNWSPMTTRIAGSPLSISPATSWWRRTASPIPPGSTGVSTSSAGFPTTMRCGSNPRPAAGRSCT